MTMKRATILVLASIAFAQANEMVGDIGSSSMLTWTSPAANHSHIIMIGVTNPPAMPTHTTSHTTSHPPISSSAAHRNGSSVPAHNFFSKSVAPSVAPVVDSPMTAGCPAPTQHTPHTPSVANKHLSSIMTMSISGTGTGGMNVANVSAPTSQPFLGNGVESGVSINLLLVSFALTALLQM
ncbi:hypothetical protein F5Y10DRAFT_240588 [Nemania abortiva]|nr:hypothetical protein F5Y10DRAFT_240588 [Nemania abortiva]